MASRVKEDERNERTIRGLLKLPENRRCINCNSLGPQYVCTNFWTFVCTTCGGIHREFTHRVKSVSMAKFTSQEVAALQEGGNKHARDIYLKEWDPQRQSAPDSSNVERLRDFIKHIYVDRRYSGEKNYGKPPSVKVGEREDSYENRRTDMYQSGSRSPPSVDSYERHYNERSSPGGRGDDKNNRYGYDERRSPGHDQEGRQYNDYRTSPSHPEVINNWRWEDRFGNGRRVEDHVTSEGDTKLEGRSPEHLKDPGASSPPIVRPVREILGDNVVPLRINEPPKANVRTASSSSLGSTNGNPVEVKLETAGSLIDFDDPEPPVTTSVPQAQQTMPQSTAPPSTTINDNNWASFDNAPQVKVSQAPSNANPLEFVLSQLSFPASVAGQSSGIPSSSGAPVVTMSAGNVAALPTIGASPVLPAGNASMLLFNAHTPVAAPVRSLSTLHPIGVSVAAPGLAPTMPAYGSNSFVRVTETGQLPVVQHQQPSLFPASIDQSTVQHSARLDGASGSQPWNLPLAPNMHASIQSMGAPQVISKPSTGLISTGASQPLAAEKSSGRKELPADLFTATYSAFGAPIPVWHTGVHHGMGFPMQYNNAAVPMSNVLQQPRSTNPFDVNESQVAQAQNFPSMATLDGALPSVSSSSGLQHASSLGTPSPAWVSSQLSYRTALPSHSQHYASAMPPGAYMMAQVPSSIPPSRPQAMGGLGHSVAAFGARSMDQQMSGRPSTPPAQQPFSLARGNPFG